VVTINADNEEPEPVDSDHPRGRQTSRALAEVRTVIGRAVTAKRALQTYPGCRSDPDCDLMIEDLDRAVEALDRWKRTGRIH